MAGVAPDQATARPLGYGIFLVTSALLVLRFLWSVVVPGGEWPLPPWPIINMAVDGILLVCVLVIGGGIVSGMPRDDRRRATARLMFWGGLVAGAGLLLIRFTGEAAWWTGHLRNGLL